MNCNSDPERLRNELDFAILHDMARSPVCFVAGTLVHTDKGLVPIEDIKIGDLVLSKAEDGNGPNRYQRVVNTFKTADREVWHVSCARHSDENLKVYQLEEYVVTPEHPLRLIGKIDDNINPWQFKPNETARWASVRDLADMLYSGDIYVVESIDGVILTLWNIDLLRKMLNPLQAVVVSHEDPDDSGQGHLIDFETATAHQYIDRERDHVLIDTERDLEEEKFPPYTTTVYNLEVENDHTYFVGRHGLWVHNACIVDAQGGEPSVSRI